MALGTQPLSEDEMRRTWALVGLLTSLKRRANHPPPTAQWIRRKIDALSLPALETLSILVEHTIIERHCRLSPRQVFGMAQAVRVFPEDTALEVAHVHACDNVVSAAAVKSASFNASHALRLGLEHLAEARKRGMPLCPISTDRHLQAIDVLARGGRNEKSAVFEILDIDDANILEHGGLVSSNGLLIGAACCITMMDRIDLSGDICCGSCYQVASADELSICLRCGDHLACKGCLSNAKHATECGRVRSMVWSMAQRLTPHIRESARRVSVVQLGSSGLIAPMSTTSIASPLVPSSILESLSRCSTVVGPSELQVYWRLLISFLADQEGDDQEAIEYERSFDVQAANRAMVEPQPHASTSKRSKLLPSERRRQRKEMRAAESRAKEEALLAAEAVAMAEANSVLERQAARPDATSSMLTSVLLKRGSIASPEVVARTRAKRDSLKAAEMRARKPTKAKPEEPKNATEQKRTNRGLTDACLVAAAILLQRRARTWLRCRKKLHRKVRSRAAKRIQSSIRTWLLRAVAEASITVTAGSNSCEGTDGEEPESAEPEPPKPASTETATAECAICLDDDAEYAVVPCGHRCLCVNCSKAVSECPVCRGEMAAVLRVFV